MNPVEARASEVRAGRRQARREPAAPSFADAVRKRTAGADLEVALFDGRRRSCVNLDNAATTPAFTDVIRRVGEFLPWYGSIHRGTGVKAAASSRAYEAARRVVAEWVGADPDAHAVIFTHGTTDAINRAAHTLGDGRPLVLCTRMEHHSNLLPWRVRARVEIVDVRRGDGALDLDQLGEKLRAARGAVKLVAVTGASNVTGLTPPLGAIARLAHEHGAQVLADAAQLMPHRRVLMGAPGEPESLEFLAFSAHKMYAPFGAGALIGPRSAFERAWPASVGGGAVRLVTDDDVVWADAPAREEAGTPNVVGAVALAAAIKVLSELGMDEIARHELRVRSRAAELLAKLPGVRLYGAQPTPDHGQVAVLAFDSTRVAHGLLAAALGHEWGIGVRHGCFCAHPYIAGLLGLSPAAIAEMKSDALRNDRSRFPGLVRLSFAAYNTIEEAEYAAEAVEAILTEGPRARYALDRTTGEYLPEA